MSKQQGKSNAGATSVAATTAPGARGADKDVRAPGAKDQPRSITTESLSAGLLAVLGPTSVGANAPGGAGGQANEEAAEAGSEAGAGDESPLADAEGTTEAQDINTEDGEGTVSQEGTEGTDGEEDLINQELQTEEDSDSDGEVSKEWPANAIAAVAKLRAERREAKAKAEEAEAARAAIEAEAAELRQQLDSSLSNAGAATENDPLAGIARTAAEVAEFARVVKGQVRLIEDFLDDAVDAGSAEEAALIKLAQGAGAWNAEEKTFHKGALKKLMRQGQDALAEHVPARLRAIEAERESNAAVSKSKGFEFWSKPGSQEYKDAMQVLRDVPGISALPSRKFAAGVFALGMREWRKLNPTAGKGGNSRGGAEARSGEGAEASAQQRPTAAKPKVNPNAVKLPGSATKLPRNGDGAGNQLEVLRKRAFGENATRADMEAYTKASILQTGIRNAA